MARLLSINVGLPRDVPWKGVQVHTAIWKQPVQGRVAIRRLNIAGDGQGDLAGGSLEFPVLQFAGVRRSLRCSRPMVVPYRSLPYLRVRADWRNRPVSA